MKKTISILLILVGVNFAQEKKEFKPTVFGDVRTSYIMSMTEEQQNQGSFSIRTARIAVKGSVNDYLSYLVRADFLRFGSLSTSTEKDTLSGQTFVKSVSAKFSDVLQDAFIAIKPVKALEVRVGQYKIPFSTSNYEKGPLGVDFSNRPLLAANVSPYSTLRDIGVMATYDFKDVYPAKLIVGVFNGSNMNAKETDKTAELAVRGVISPVKDLNLSANLYSAKRIGVNETYLNFGANYKFDNFYIDGEYSTKNRDLATAINSMSYYAYVKYTFELSEGSFFSHIIPAIRFDTYDPDNDIAENEINRITIGLSLVFPEKKFPMLRINYEKYDYKNGQPNPNRLYVDFQLEF